MNLSMEIEKGQDVTPGKYTPSNSSSKSCITYPLPLISKSASITQGETKIIYDVETYFPPMSFFKEEVIHPAIIIPARRTGEIRKKLKAVLMYRAKVKHIYPVPENANERKLVLALRLPPSDEKSTDKEKENNDDVYSYPPLKELLSNQTGNIRKSTFTFQTSYNHLNVEETLRKIIPSSGDEDIPGSSFEMIGSLIHLNLREEYWPFKYLIGKVILDKHWKTNVQTIVNKIGTIENEFRTFPMEVIASKNKNIKDIAEGDDKDRDKMYEVEVKEEGCKFRLNFKYVYWNSRLQFEHKRMVKLIGQEQKENLIQMKKDSEKKKCSKTAGSTTTTTESKSTSTEEETEKKSKLVKPTIVADVMAGIGPFAIPLASQYPNMIVHANDLNPHSFKYLQANAKLSHNKPMKNSKLTCYNLDGREFIHLISRNAQVEKEGNGKMEKPNHYIMNLPAIALEFLDAFRGYPISAAPKEDGTMASLPTIHVYCFAPKKIENAKMEIVGRIEKALGISIPLSTASESDSVEDDDTFKIVLVTNAKQKSNKKCILEKEHSNNVIYLKVVRDISPSKNMYCVSFRLPRQVCNVDKIILEQESGYKMEPVPVDTVQKNKRKELGKKEENDKQNINDDEDESKEAENKKQKV